MKPRCIKQTHYMYIYVYKTLNFKLHNSDYPDDGNLTAKQVGEVSQKLVYEQ